KALPIYIQNEKSNTIDILLNGKVAIQKIEENGDVLTVATFSSGDILGGSLAFSMTNEYPLTVIAAAESNILHIKKELILKLCQSNEEFLVKFLQSLSTQNLTLTNKIKSISMKSIRDKIIGYLTYEYYAQNSTIIRLNISKKELAERFGVQRPSLFREMKKMKEEGLIDYDHSHIIILDENII